MILVTHFACCHQYKGYWRSCPLGWSYFTVMPGLNLRAGGAYAPEFTIFLARTLEEEDFETLGAKFGLSYKGAAALYYRTIQKIRKSIVVGGDKG